MKKIGFMAFLVFLALSFLATRNLIFTPGTVGHNWDWLVPPRIDYLQELFFQSFSTWQNSNLGESRIFQLPSLPFMLFLLLPSFFGQGGDFISKFLIISTMVISGVGMFLLLENLLERKAFFASFLAGFFYAFSPFLFAEFIGGAATQFFAYALFPWFLFFTRCLNQEKKKFWFYLLLSSLILSLLTISLQVLVLASLTVFAYTLIQPKKLLFLKNLVFLYLAYFFLNLYWVLPTIGEFLNFKSLVFSSGFFDPTHLKINVPSLWEIFVATGYWRPLFLYALKPGIVNFWLGAAFLMVIFIFTTNLVLKKSRESSFWLVVLLISFIFATGGKEPMGDQVLWLYSHFPLLALFRSPQHLLVVPTFAFAVLLGLAGGAMKIKNKVFKFFLFLGVVFWLHPFFLYGDIGGQYLAREKKDHLDVFRLSPGYQKAFDFLKAQREKSDFRILFLPLSASPRYLLTQYQNEAQGGDPLVIYSPWGTLVSDINYNPASKTLAELLEKKIYEQEDSRTLPEFLTLLNIRYLFLRKDVVPEFSENKEIWSPERISKYLESNPNLKRISTFEDLEVFENLVFRLRALIFLTDGAIYSNNNPGTLWDGISLKIFEPQKEILVANYDQKQIHPAVLGKKNIFLELAFSEPSKKIVHQNTFDFTLPTSGNYELLVKKEDYLNNLQQDPLSPLNFKLDGLLMKKNPFKENKGWFSYGRFNLGEGDHKLEIILPETRNLLSDASFEEGTWSKKPQASLISERVDGQKALQLVAEDQSISVSQEIKNIKPQALYKISFWAKTGKGEPPHIAVFQDTDVVREGKIIPKLNRYLGKDASYRLFETKLRTNIDSQKAALHLYADRPQDGEQTVVFYDKVEVERLFDSPVFWRQNDFKTIEEPLLPKINFRRINKTKYLVEIQGASLPYFLTFTESFNRQWKIFPLEEKESADLALVLRNWFRQSLPESNHYLANDYANAWYLKKRGNYQLLIEYRPQRLFYLGSLLSLLFFLFLVASLARSRFLPKRSQR